MENILVYVASLNSIKINAVRRAFEYLFPKYIIEVIGVETKSGVNAQPINYETFIGCNNRYTQLLGQPIKTRFVFFVAIENGIFNIGTRHFDIGVIKIGCLSGHTITITTRPTEISDLDYLEAKKRGFEFHTVGDIVSERTGCHPQDPHFILCGIHREDLITEVIIQFFLYRIRLFQIKKNPGLTSLDLYCL